MTDVQSVDEAPPMSDAMVSWVAAGVIVGVLSVGVGGVAITSGIAYGLVGGLAVGWFASRGR